MQKELDQFYEGNEHLDDFTEYFIECLKTESVIETGKINDEQHDKLAAILEMMAESSKKKSWLDRIAEFFGNLIDTFMSRSSTKSLY